MKEQETKDKFLQLRAEGVSYEKISKMLKVSKPTLIEWGKSYKNAIEQLKAIRYEQILEKYKVTSENRIERIAKELQTAWKYFNSKDYKDLSKKEIFNIITGLEKRLKEEIEPVLIKKKAEAEEPESYKIGVYHSTFYKDEKTNKIITEESSIPSRIVELKPLDRR